MLRRSITAYERAPVESNVYVQLGFKLSDLSLKDHVVNTLKEKSIGLRMATDLVHVFPSENKFYPIELPDSLKDFDSASLYLYDTHTPNIGERLATLGYTDDMVMLSSSHMCSDGVYLKELSDCVFGRSKVTDRKLPISISPEDSFRNEIFACHGLTENKSTIIETKYRDYGLLASVARHIPFDINYEDLKCFNKEKKKAERINDYLWSAMVLSASAFNGEYKNFGIATCVNLRQFMDYHTMDQCDLFSKIYAIVKSHGTDETIDSVVTRFRNDFMDRIEYKELFRHIKYFDNSKKQPPYLGLEVSNIGVIDLPDGFEDLFIGLQMTQYYCTAEVCALSYTIKKKDRTIFRTRMRYPPSRCDDKQARIFTKSVEYFLLNIPLSAKIGEALKELIDYQKSLWKHQL